ncbi:2'-5' RNA ligase family protein [Clostridium sp. UBA1056]|uniref:2'-5' RNA ligase family protein n=1 Tax=unclassified Clostridium TaxID=2614128 RepID=UPI003216639F
MRYVIVSVIKGEAGDFNNNLRKEVYEKFKAKSSKLPAHFTIKAPFEYDDDITEIEKSIEDYCIQHRREPLEIKGYNHFDDRVIYMDMAMSREGRILHDGLIEEMSKVPYIEFTNKDGKDKIFHITISSKRIKSIYYDLWNYVNKYPCSFQSYFDNVSIYRWENNTWVLHKEYLFQQ